MNLRFGLLFVVAGLLLFVVVRWWISEPTISVDFSDAPLAKVITAFEKQGKIRLTTNIDPETPVTIRTRRTPVVDALDLLAARLDGDWRAVYILGPDSQKIREGKAMVALSGREMEGWRSYRLPTWGEMLLPRRVDPETLIWKVEPMEQQNLSAYLDQGSQKLPVQFLTPQDWDPSVTGAPREGSPFSVASALAKKAGGRADQVFLIARQQRGRGGEGPGNQDNTGPPVPRGEGGMGQRPGINQAWVAERTEAIIATLPPEEKKEASEAWSEMRALREKVGSLEPEARREAMEEFFSRPDVQDRMEEAMAVRDARRSPEQREARYRRSVNRKLEKRAAEGRPMVAKP